MDRCGRMGCSRSVGHEGGCASRDFSSHAARARAAAERRRLFEGGITRVYACGACGDVYRETWRGAGVTDFLVRGVAASGAALRDDECRACPAHPTHPGRGPHDFEVSEVPS